jgi:hypothetical protein
MEEASRIVAEKAWLYFKDKVGIFNWSIIVDLNID